jgi:hypothetical protein
MNGRLPEPLFLKLRNDRLQAFDFGYDNLKPVRFRNFLPSRFVAISGRGERTMSDRNAKEGETYCGKHDHPDKAILVYRESGASRSPAFSARL